MKKRTVVLIKIWSGDTRYSQAPLSLILLGEQLKKAGYNVKVFHLTKYNALSKIDDVLRCSPLLVGFSLITGDPLDVVLEFCNKLKSKNKKTPIKPIAEQIIFGGKKLKLKEYRREQFYSGYKFSGPALVLEDTSTIFIPPGYK